MSSPRRISNVAASRDDLAQVFEALAGNIGHLTRQPGDVAARARKTGDDAAADRIARRREHDRNRRCRLLCCEGSRSVVGDDDIDLEPNKLVCEISQTLGVPLGPAILDSEIAALNPAQLAQSLHEGGGPLALRRRATRAEQSDSRRLRLLCARGERPSRRHATEKRDKFAAFHGQSASGASDRKNSTPSVWQETPALRHFNPPYVGCGSSTAEVVDVTPRCMPRHPESGHSRTQRHMLLGANSDIARCSNLRRYSITSSAR